MATPTTDGRVQIGWFLVQDGETFRNQYETAAWYQDVAASAQKVAITARRTASEVDEVRVESFQGTLVDDYFGALLGGVHVGSSDGKHRDQYGQPAAVHGWSVYTYELAEAVAQGDPRYELLPGWQARPSFTVHDCDGRFATPYDRMRIHWTIAPANSTPRLTFHAACDLAGCRFEARIREGYDAQQHVQLVRLREWGCKSYERPCGACLKPVARRGAAVGLCAECARGGRTDRLACGTCERAEWLDQNTERARRCPYCSGTGVIAKAEATA